MLTGDAAVLVVRHRTIGDDQIARRPAFYQRHAPADCNRFAVIIKPRCKTVNAAFPNWIRFVAFDHNSLTGEAISARMRCLYF
jgi:hypothetical protein